MDDDSETTYEMWIFLSFNLKTHLYLCLLVNETLHCCQPEVNIPSSQAIRGDLSGGSAPLFRQRITIHLIVSKAVHSRGPHRSGQLHVMRRIHNTLIVVDWYLRLMGDKMIPDSAEPRLESFYPPFLAGNDLPHQGVVDSYNLHNGNSCTGQMASFCWNSSKIFDKNNIHFHTMKPEQNGRHSGIILCMHPTNEGRCYNHQLGSHTIWSLVILHIMFIA